MFLFVSEAGDLLPLAFKMYDKVGDYIVIIEEKVLGFWSNVSSICSPHEAKLTETIVSHHLMGVEQVRSEKGQSIYVVRLFLLVSLSFRQDKTNLERSLINKFNLEK